MSKLLVSVTSAEEALLALAGGADIIDMKNPSQGALGALPLQVVNEAVAAVDGRKITSATTGDLPMEPALICQAVMQMAETGVDLIKVGFFGNEQDNIACLNALQPLIAERKLAVVAVLMADLSPQFGLLPLLREAGFWGVMLDTATKDGRNLLSHLDAESLGVFLQLAEGMQTGLAGSLKIENIKNIVKMKPSYIGVRGAVCVGFDRVAKLCKDKVSGLSVLLYNCNKSVESADLA
ncbi:(5-formylfuran-3-yl)methyl phosphate synthase [Methylobacillus flagellatus]|uniref:(5-formylfuran-3-yl)methyl phosphate synthase n=1 Tax=Methylobacillus flagellatus TaxID=405 RepID=UPI002853EBBD|nr:(5-formylfuran-3-yl)methyl phosphate synthase [Methylobacillus flagellatus]MDR5171528.1 (5-formylfuran-3-yl)methyl phosphate synthase [Methylobacillus flagellatus]